MNEIELREKLNLIENRQKHILGNQLAILESIEKDRERQARFRASFNLDGFFKNLAFGWIFILGCGFILTLL